MIYHLTPADVFQEALTAARSASPAVHAFTESTPGRADEGTRCYLSEDGRSGYTVQRGYLSCVFSLVPGRGAGLVASAVLRGADEGDCFGTFLRDLYVRGGFTQVYSARWDEEQFTGTDEDRATIFGLCGDRPRVYFFSI